MTRYILRRILPALPLAALAGGVSFAQGFPQPGQPTVPAPAADKDGVEVLTRGPIHEAYAASAEMPTGGPVVEKRPPDAVEELPPDQKPDGDNVQWIPGYWQFDEERKDFIWISGFWRDAPPGRVWVPGGWQETRGGFQWVSGFWNAATPAVQAGVAPQAQLEYLPPPPATLEAGPTIVSPGADYFYTPGSWVYRVNRYVWRPGFWVVHRPGWVWVPDHYRWTPVGYVFVPGYWDVPLERRGVLFAPVYFSPAVVVRPRFVYTPVYAVPAPSLYTSLFVRTGYGGYYFGDYFEPRYATAGYSSWAVSIRGSNFAIGVSGGRGYAYDPLWSYYSVEYRREPVWQQNITNVYVGRYKGDIPRPPTTLVQQTTVINNITNNNTTIVNNNTTTNNKTVNTAPATAAQMTMVTPLADLKKTSPTVALKPVAAEDRTKEQQAAKELRQVAVERRKAETQLVARGQVVAKADDKPLQAKVELPKTAVARAQMPTTGDKAPPPPPAAVLKKPDTPTAPVVPGGKPADLPKPGAGTPTNPMPPTTPKPVDPPKLGPGTPVPLVGPKPMDPKPPVTPPKTDPPKPGDPPKGPPAPPTTPPKTDPPKTDPPKVDPPKTPVTPPVTSPKVDPPKTGPGTPLPPVAPPPPKVDPPKGPGGTPPQPLVSPPKVDAPKSDPPKGPGVPTRPGDRPKDDKRKDDKK